MSEMRKYKVQIFDACDCGQEPWEQNWEVEATSREEAVIQVWGPLPDIHVCGYHGHPQVTVTEL